MEVLCELSQVVVHVPLDHELFENNEYFKVAANSDDTHIVVACTIEDFEQYLAIYRINVEDYVQPDTKDLKLWLRRSLIGINVGKTLCDFFVVDKCIQMIYRMCNDIVKTNKNIDFFYYCLIRQCCEIFPDYRVQIADIICNMPFSFTKHLCKKPKTSGSPLFNRGDVISYLIDKDDVYHKETDTLCGLSAETIISSSINSTIRYNNWTSTSRILLKYLNDATNITFDEECELLQHGYRLLDVQQFLNEVTSVINNINDSGSASMKYPFAVNSDLILHFMKAVNSPGSLLVGKIKPGQLSIRPLIRLTYSTECMYQRLASWSETPFSSGSISGCYTVFPIPSAKRIEDIIKTRGTPTREQVREMFSDIQKGMHQYFTENGESEIADKFYYPLPNYL